MTTTNGEIPSSFSQAVKKGAVMLSSGWWRIFAKVEFVRVVSNIVYKCLGFILTSTMDNDRARRHGKHSELGGPSGAHDGEADFISAVPTDLLLQVLVCLCCARAAARTSILSRRWRGLWTHLPELTFHDVAPDPLLAALSLLGPAGAPLALLDIHVPEPQVPVDHDPTWVGGRARRQSYRLQPLHPTNQITMLLRAAGRLSPAVFRFTHLHELENPYVDVDLSSCFSRATSIELDAEFICFPEPQSELPKKAFTPLYR
uniref:F-box domain-containing protein n=1 Tax=Aegilops tauschii TaxID=37682 RepID=M8CE58_AEGTA